MLLDKSMEFVERLQHEDIETTIFSNFNYPPDSDRMKRLIDYSHDLDFKVKCSWHESSNIEYVKANIIQCQDFMEEVILLVNDDNLLEVYEIFQWIKENTNCRIGVEELLLPNGESTFTGFDSDIYNTMVGDEKASDYLTIATIDDKEYTFAESKMMDFKNISSQYFTLCKLSQLRIKWDGVIISECGYPYRGHINDGINVNEIFCSGHTCYCDIDIYKKLLRPRKRHDS